MGTITEPYAIGREWGVQITRKNGTTYVVRSDDYQSIVDYRKEFIEQATKRKTK